MTKQAGIEAFQRVRDVPLSAFSLVQRGKAYDLASGWWPGMPIAAGHPPFQVVTYRTPQGERVQRDMEFLADNTVGFGFISELLMMTAHSGTHIDALCHVAYGSEAAWHGGHRVADWLGDFGPLADDVAALPPLLCRGVLLDVAGALGVPHLATHEPIGSNELATAASRQGVELRAGDVVLVRTGTMSAWPDTERLAAIAGAGLSLDGAQWLIDRAPAAIGADNVAVEVSPSGISGDPQPVHRFVIAERGIPLLEWVYLEALATERVSEFLFLCLPLPIRGATGSPVRPLAVV